MKIVEPNKIKLIIYDDIHLTRWPLNINTIVDNFMITFSYATLLTHWGRVTHICVSELTIIGSDNGLSPGRCQAIIWTNDDILLIGPLGTNFNEILFGIQTFLFNKKKNNLKLSPAKWRPFCLGINVLKENYDNFGQGFPNHYSELSNWQESPLVQVMVWHNTGDKPLSEPMLSKFISYSFHFIQFHFIYSSSELNHTRHTDVSKSTDDHTNFISKRPVSLRFCLLRSGHNPAGFCHLRWSFLWTSASTIWRTKMQNSQGKKSSD